MNNKKAKALRRLARECSVGLQSVAYEGDTVERKGLIGGLIRTRRVYTGKPRVCAPNTQRAVYNDLKRKTQADVS